MQRRGRTLRGALSPSPASNHRGNSRFKPDLQQVPESRAEGGGLGGAEPRQSWSLPSGPRAADRADPPGRKEKGAWSPGACPLSKEACVWVAGLGQLVLPLLV